MRPLKGQKCIQTLVLCTETCLGSLSSLWLELAEHYLNLTTGETHKELFIRRLSNSKCKVEPDVDCLEAASRGYEEVRVYIFVDLLVENLHELI